MSDAFDTADFYGEETMVRYPVPPSACGFDQAVGFGRLRWTLYRKHPNHGWLPEHTIDLYEASSLRSASPEEWERAEKRAQDARRARWQRKDAL